MSDHHDPPRLADSAGSDLLASALRGARADMPGDAAVEAALARFPVITGPAGGGTSSSDAGPSLPPTAAPGAGGLGLAAKIGLAVVVAAMGSVAVVGLGRPKSEATPPAASARAVVAPVSTHRAEETPPPIETSEPEASAPLPAPSARPAEPKQGPADDRTEMELLRDAQAARGGNAEKALALCALHQRKFPRGALGQERDMIRIQALLSLGRTGEARALAQDFRARHPSSAHNARLDDLVPR